MTYNGQPLGRASDEQLLTMILSAFSDAEETIEELVTEGATRGTAPRGAVRGAAPRW